MLILACRFSHCLNEFFWAFELKAVASSTMQGSMHSMVLKIEMGSVMGAVFFIELFYLPK